MAAPTIRYKHPRGKTTNARKVFGEPPRDCPKCGARGGVIDTRVGDGQIRRRRACRRGHRWTTLELICKNSVSGIHAMPAMEADIRKRALGTLMAVLKEMSRE